MYIFLKYIYIYMYILKIYMYIYLNIYIYNVKNTFFTFLKKYIKIVCV